VHGRIYNLANLPQQRLVESLPLNAIRVVQSVLGENKMSWKNCVSEVMNQEWKIKEARLQRRECQLKCL
jgi:hypothetical protein